MAQSLLGRPLKRNEKRALQFLVAAVVVFAAMEFIVFPLVDSADQLRASLPLREKTLVKYQNRAALAGYAELDEQTLQARLTEAERSMLDSRTPAMGFGEVQELVKRKMAEVGIEAQGATFQTVRQTKSGYAFVPVAVSFNCTLDQFVSFLVALHSAPKALALEQLGISYAPPRTEKPRKTIATFMVIRAVMAPETTPPPATEKKG